MNGTQFIGMLKSMDNLTSLKHEGKDGINYLFFKHSCGWDVWTMVGQNNVSVQKFDRIEDTSSLLALYVRDAYVGALTKSMLGVEY